MALPLNSSMTVIDIINKSNEVDPDLIASYMHNRAVNEPAYSLLIFMYSLLILTGASGNSLVIISVVRKPAMRTPRNMFILNLAVSDFLLCTVTMPLTLMEILTKYWPLGNYLILCKMKNALQATSIFVTTITIAAIALDRYRVIVYPTRESLNLCLTGAILLAIWIIASILASPLFIYTQLVHHDLQINGTDLGINFCIEDWPFKDGRALYSVFSIIFQYFVPIIIVSTAYLSIYLKLRYRFAAGFVSNEEFSQNSTRRQTRGRKLKRTNMLLISIALVFCISWLPLNLFNLIADIYSSEIFSQNTGMVIYAVCHMISMSSACSNPVLYGWLNENFWKEFKDIMCLTSNSTDNNTAAKRSSFKGASRKALTKETPDVVVMAGDFHAGNMSTEMTNLTS
ncbi:7 transmembrane receptor (rhodopsin family) [Popillia japonica]|uniref:7 transmembrane receptor (Rhodopsin family) n=1 Tax=Popillia japonica TaxID=7064 RepID=A0AAW1LBI8_POPJA